MRPLYHKHFTLVKGEGFYAKTNTSNPSAPTKSKKPHLEVRLFDFQVVEPDYSPQTIVVVDPMMPRMFFTL